MSREYSTSLNSFPFNNTHQCLHCLNYADISQVWCPFCGVFIGKFTLSSDPQHSDGFNQTISNQQMQSDINTGLSVTSDGSNFTNRKSNYMNAPQTYETNYLLEDPSNMRQRYLSGPLNSNFNVLIHPQIGSFQSQDEHLGMTSAPYHTGMISPDAFENFWIDSNNQMPKNVSYSNCNLPRQKFASESTYENDFEQMRFMLSACYTEETPRCGPRWATSQNSQHNLSSNKGSNFTNKERISSLSQGDIQCNRPYRSKRRSCSRGVSAKCKSDKGNKQLNQSIRNRPPSANDAQLTQDTSPIYQFEKDFGCELPPAVATIPSDLRSDLKNWHFLPSEIWFQIASYLDYKDRTNLALTNKRFASLLRDPYMWRRISLHHRQSLNNEQLENIARRKPRQLHFMYCKAPQATLSGISHFLSNLRESLTHLSFSGCSKGAFENDSFLLRAVEKCPNLQHIDASYTIGIRDQTVIYIAKHVRNLRSFLLNGAQCITINAIRNLVKYQYGSLERLELFGCFKLNSNIFELLSTCLNLRVLSFGHLHHLCASGLLQLVEKLPNLSSLDLRGTMKLVNDTSLTQLADHCPLLEEFVLANTRVSLRESSLAEMLSRLQRLRVLDLCGILAVGDIAMQVLAASCPDLQELEISCSSVTEAGIQQLIDKRPSSLHTIGMSYCKISNREIFINLVKACPKLSKIVAYGYENIKDWDEVLAIRNKEGAVPLEIETESISKFNSDSRVQTNANPGMSCSLFRLVPLDKI